MVGPGDTEKQIQYWDPWLQIDLRTTQIQEILSKRQIRIPVLIWMHEL